MIDDWEDYSSGPFCPHWSAMGDCDDKVCTCGHTCNQHGNAKTPCGVGECECDRFTDPAV